MSEALAILDALCQDSLDQPLDHVYALERDGLLDRYEISAKFHRLATIIQESERVRRRLADAVRLIAEKSQNWEGETAAAALAASDALDQETAE